MQSEAGLRIQHVLRRVDGLRRPLLRQAPPDNEEPQSLLPRQPTISRRGHRRRVEKKHSTSESQRYIACIRPCKCACACLRLSAACARYVCYVQCYLRICRTCVSHVLGLGCGVSVQDLGFAEFRGWYSRVQSVGGCRCYGLRFGN